MTKSLFILVAAVLMYVVGCDKESTYSSRTSACGGFDAPTGILLAVENCDEMLLWTYDEATEKLTLRNDDVTLNCGVEGALDVEVTGKDGGYKIIEWARPKLTANCMCRFDYETTLNNIAPGTLTMAVAQHFVEYTVPDGNSDLGEKLIWSGTFDLSQKSGSILIKTQDYCW